ncbi:MAG: FGGY-family carbohydrate kinase [Caldilineaceae bacterium]
MTDLVLAIDLGSSWCKAAYLDRQGNMVADGRAFTRAIQPSRDAMLPQFWNALCTAVRMARERLPYPPTPAAIGISCRAQFGVSLTADGQAFWPTWDCLLTKTSPEIQRAYSPALWGNQDPYAFGYGVRMAAMMPWLHQRRPDEWRKIDRIGALHNYLVYRLAGVWVTDPTSGAEQAEWPPEIVAMSGLPRTAFPHTLLPHHVAGGLTTDAAAALGLPSGTPVVVGMHDGAAANLGTRTIEAGDACFTLGTNFVFRAVTGERLTTKCFCYTVAPNRWAWVNNVPSASTQFDIVAELLRGHDAAMTKRHQALGQLADNVAPGAEGLTMERMTPSEEAAWQQRLLAIRQAGYADGVIYRAVAEAIAWGVYGLVQTAKRDGVRPRRFVATGGSAQNRHFLHVLAAVLGVAIEIGAPEAGLLGVGMVAAIGSGWYATLQEAMNQMTTPGPVVQPDPDAVQFYQTL